MNSTVGDYLLARLHEAGIDNLFGVPGDYNLQFLDSVLAHPSVAWVGCTNELNAAYAADGYARCRGAGALLTTFGVGELSAINGTAGSFAEYVPVIHIVGAPPLQAQREGQLLHHSFGDGDFQRFLRMQKEVTIDQAMLTADQPCMEIDRVIITALRARRPVCLVVPCDIAALPAALPDEPMNGHRDSCPRSLEAFRVAASELLRGATRVALLADFLAGRFGAGDVLARWVEEQPLAFSTLLMGKGILPEQHPRFAGTYAGAASDAVTRRAIEQAEVLILAGTLFSDTLTAGFSQQIDRKRTIEIQPCSCRVGDETFSGITFVDAVTVLRQLTVRLTLSDPLDSYHQPDVVPDACVLSQLQLWRAMQNFIRPGDIILADQGTAAFGAASLRLPPGCRLLVQPLWGSIGYTLPAAFGAQTALPHQRIILLIGDGSAQLTIQEISSMMRDGQRPVIFILNNGGYTVERAIHGPQQRYNDIAAWNWTGLPAAFSLSPMVQSWRVNEHAQLEEVMGLVNQQSQMTLVEVCLPQQDLPPLLQAVSAALHRNAAF
ncbi:indolepyruvate decarboxylase [Izhakiella australiensis]|uniref:Indolepyruvate decarboxylase n=1 Tax=Izhakiella australiensis TaxID=1926881 RepID=A0A1S8YJ35_9GAMM|nr:alpha-keto acid decarboxylase family protein [Izhakiella australiensis]OON39074.1 indolepyruvate decarboxylase [Izhakiella australiensis]